MQITLHTNNSVGTKPSCTPWRDANRRIREAFLKMRPTHMYIVHVMDMVEWQSAQAGKPYRKPVCDGLFDQTVMLSLVTLTIYSPNVNIIKSRNIDSSSGKCKSRC
jgi:hypothetical protein